MNPPLTQSDAVCFPSCCCGKCCCVHSRTLQHLRIMLDLPTQIVASAIVSQVNSTTATAESIRLLAGSLQINLPYSTLGPQLCQGAGCDKLQALRSLPVQ